MKETHIVGTPIFSIDCSGLKEMIDKMLADVKKGTETRDVIFDIEEINKMQNEHRRSTTPADHRVDVIEIKDVHGNYINGFYSYSTDNLGVNIISFDVKYYEYKVSPLVTLCQKIINEGITKENYDIIKNKLNSDISLEREWAIGILKNIKVESKDLKESVEKNKKIKLGDIILGSALVLYLRHLYIQRKRISYQKTLQR